MSDAQKYFEENLRLLGSTQKAQAAANPEKYNFYTALSVMARQLSEIESRLEKIQVKLELVEKLARR